MEVQRTAHQLSTSQCASCVTEDKLEPISIVVSHFDPRSICCGLVEVKSQNQDIGEKAQFIGSNLEGQFCLIEVIELHLDGPKMVCDQVAEAGLKVWR